MNRLIVDEGGTGTPTGPQVPPKAPRPRQKRSLVLFEWVVIMTAAGGFIYKFTEFGYSVLHAPSEAVNFAITPLVMYLSVALGFFLLFIWSILRGDYKEIELPKYRLFEREAEIDAEEATTHTTIDLHATLGGIVIDGKLVH